MGAVKPTSLLAGDVRGKTASLLSAVPSTRAMMVSTPSALLYVAAAAWLMSSKKTEALQLELAGAQQAVLSSCIAPKEVNTRG